MILALTLAAFSALVFTEQEIPGLCFGPRAPSTQRATDFNYWQVDMDGDGAVDLVTDHDVLFQRDGGFPDSASTPLPDYGERIPWCDAWRGELYQGFPGRLLIVKWADGKWQTRSESAIEWPPTFEELRLSGKDTGERMAMERFVHGIDGDGTPEFVFCQSDGVHIYALRDGAYKRVAMLDLVPAYEVLPPELDFEPRVAPKPNAVADVSRARGFRFWINATELVFLVSRGARYKTVRYTLDPAHDFAVMPEKTIEQLSEPVPACCEPCRLNNDASVDFAGERHRPAERGGRVMTLPVWETVVSTDGGKTLRRQPGLLFSCKFADMDGDGDLDMIGQSSSLYEGGLRECVARLLTDKTIAHEIVIYFQDEGGQFSAEPDVRASIDIHFDEVPARLSRMFQRYTHGHFIDVSGDFNGDHRCDLLVPDRPDRLAVYLNTGAGFEREPSAVIPCAYLGDRYCIFAATDVNADGRSDIMVIDVASEQSYVDARAICYFAKEGGG